MVRMKLHIFDESANPQNYIRSLKLNKQRGQQTISLRDLDGVALRHLPNADRALVSDGYNVLIVGRDAHGRDIARVRESRRVHDALIVMPKLHSAVLAHRHKQSAR